MSRKLVSEARARKGKVEVIRKRVTRVIAESYEETIIREFKDPTLQSLSFDPSELVSRVSSEECNEASAIDDLEIRKELTRIVGLPFVPEKSDRAYEEISGIFDDIIDEDEIDVVAWVKSVRRTK